MAETLLRLEDLEVSRGMNKVLSAFQLEINSGDVVVLHSENGAGKSTVIECSARLLPLEKGSVSHHGALVLDHEGRRNRPVHPFGLTLQSNGLVGDETVENHLMTVCALSQMTADLTPLLESYGLAHRRHDRIGQLSGGQARKVAVIAGLLPAMLSEKPRLVLLDEPATGLDQSAVRTLASTIGQLRQAGHGFLIASHHPAMLECATRLHDLKKEVENKPSNDNAWKAIGQTEPQSFVATKAGQRYLRSTRAGIARNGLTALLVLGTMMAFIDPSTISDRTLLVGLTLSAPFAAGLAGDPVLYLLREQRAVDWWRANVQRLPSADLFAPLTGVAFTAIGTVVFLEAFDWKVTLIGAFVLWFTMASVRFIEINTLRLARPNAVFLRLLLPILILPWALVTEYTATL
ncbi:MAG: ATP-binding cassette domain-containing protein [Euryarchaeota archaeon]|nr:ATP-binding cassette domain-containing protein [Euryarchaeota archaeon]